MAGGRVLALEDGDQLGRLDRALPSLLVFELAGGQNRAAVQLLGGRRGGRGRQNNEEVTHSGWPTGKDA